MKVILLKYNGGNIHSVRVALLRIGYEPVITDDPSEISSADKIIFPGVGEASSAMTYLRNRSLDQVITQAKQPVLGICLGLQLMCTKTEENDTPGLGIFDIHVRKFNTQMKVPHIGWNEIHDLKHPLFKNIVSPMYVYFVHSYYAEISSFTSAVSDYSIPFSAALQKDNFFALQFHPEKSGPIGEQVLKNFLEL